MPKEKRSPKVRHRPRPKAAEPARPEPAPPGGNSSFPVVGIGASAGGLEAFTQFLQQLPAEPGMAFVLIQHLDPKHQSMMSELLARVSQMPVRQVSDGQVVKPNAVYVIPPDKNMAIINRTLKLTPRTLVRGQHMPIDYFFRSLAEDQGNKAIGVILSGTASDGALGLEAIKGEGGITFAQDDKTAKFAAMPRSAIATGSVDFVLPVEGIADELVRIGRHPYLAQPHPLAGDETPTAISQDDTGRVLFMLRASTGVDFTYYKRSTVKRRIMRRMTLHRIERLPDYATFLKENPEELDALYYDILIKVTGFFRDAEAFEALKTTVFPLVVKHQRSGQPIRIWVPGCATGEEVYSIAICLLEFLGERATTSSMQIFATDINEWALNKARSGLYIENIASDVSPERLRKYFVKVNNNYQIAKFIRESCVFARQNVFKDPPFSNLDMISCRNVLIYLGPALQKNVIPVFHYALKPTGFLMLGASETIGAFPDLFQLVDKKHKIYGKKLTSTRLTMDLVAREYLGEEATRLVEVRPEGETQWKEINIQKEADRLVLNHYAPPGVLINDNMEILQFRGDTSEFLKPAPGKASFDMMRMAREGLLVGLRSAIAEARRSQSPVSREGVNIRTNGATKVVTLRIIPLRSPVTSSPYYIVLFDERMRIPDLRKEKPPKIKPVPESRQVRQLKEELSVTKQHLQSIIEEYEAANEELKSANEEILSSNEELQSTNEELETAKEELQSTNEELTTVNEEVQNRNAELAQLNNDFTNILASISLPIIVLGRDLRIRICTPAAEKVLKLIPSDVGRPISDLNLSVQVPDLEVMIADVIDSVTIKEMETQDRDGHWYSMRIRPYKTAENKIDGAVLVFVDIDSLKKVGPVAASVAEAASKTGATPRVE